MNLKLISALIALVGIVSILPACSSSSGSASSGFPSASVKCGDQACVK